MINIFLKSLIFVSTICISCWSNATSTIEGNMNSLDKKQQWCTGRYSFEIPKNHEIIGVTDKYDSFVIESELATYIDFLNSIQVTQKEYTVGNSVIIKETETPKESKQKLTKIIWGDIDKSTNKGLTHVIAFVLDKGILFKIKGSYSEAYKDESFESINNVVTNLTARNNNTIPIEKGVCILNGFIKDNGDKYRFSRQIISFQYNNFPSLRLAFTVEATYKAEQNIISSVMSKLEKQGVLQSFLSSFKSIRKGEKNQNNTSNPLKGVELVVEAPMKGKSGIDATWEHTGTAKNSNDPTIVFLLDSAYNDRITKTSSLSEKDALKLYDYTLNSIKKFQE